ncbi:unnamed protein product [Cylindrotheca closterium]|uniref:RNA polymerase II assembly factor Rtp1 C-terminal domain-containing protein n=1 Tax=Cylindrotheca closterium TaxID=2856 RepID=A0AAD2CQL3_9STRA|nr:unnamed protein product [Cylindrotheca closterium]
MTAQGNKLGRLPDAHQNRKATGTLSSIKDDERYRLVHNVLLPLVRLLTQCYSILDKILPSQPKPTENTSRKKTKKPEPPVGMLSIQNYTDVACLLEFLVLTNILPYLDANVMISAQDRIQYHLPKSLAGRMPRAALAWNSMQASSISASEKSFELLTTSITISSLVMLDRFKPMLLPRHLSDLYAATFQTQQWEKVSDSQSASDIALLYRTLGLRPTSRLNPVLQAKAYQTMLLRGTKAPAWLRQTVSSLLSQLACTDLFSIIQVFCPTQEAAMASQRLGRALAGTPFKEALVQQMLGLMQGIFPTNGEISGPTVSILETVWAVLNEWSPDTIRSELIELWENGIMDTGTRDGQTIHATVRQIGALFSFVPNVSISLKVLHQIPKSIILPQLVRLGSMSSIFASNARDDAKQTLHWISQAICSVTQSTMIGSVAVSAEGLMAIAWVNSLEPNSWDLSGNEYYIQDLESQFSSIKGFECLGIRKCDASVLDLKRIIEHGTRRVDVLLETTYVVHEQEGFTRLKGLCCRIFHLILELYLSKSTKKTLSAISSMVPILSLPTLFERCSPEDLLFGDSSNATSLLFLIKISLISVDRSHKSTTINEGASTRSESPLAVENGLAEGLFEFRKVVTMHTASQTSSSLLSGLDDKEDFASSLQIAFIMLSLLVSVLEFGSTLRSLDEEEVLHSFSPVLESLAQLDENSSTVIPSYIEESRAEMADVAAYALSLIASRSAPRTREAGQLDSESPYDVLKSIIMQSENDLRSAEPPIRARGIVELGRLARGYLGIIAKENLSSGKSSLINILQDNESVSSNESTINFVVDEILRLSIGAVGDKESYVYLAAVQTIVSIGDMRPKKLIPLVASIVVTGRWQLGSAETDYQSINVTGEERIKLAEALIFMIKRRPVVEEYVPTLLALMTFGDERANHDSDKAEDSLFRSETHKYFITEAKQEAGEYEPSQKELWEEKDIRLKTGGPVFKAEELDVVRAARASVLAALVSKSPPRTIALDCAFLVRLINDTLVLETSRSVCRAIATLALALYESALRELEEVLAALETASAQMVTTRASIPFTVALISSDEEVLHSNLAAKSTGGLAVSQQTLNDPATSARCKEALILRQQAEETGLFSCARIALSQDLSNRDYPQMLRVLKANADMGVKVKLSIE